MNHAFLQTAVRNGAGSEPVQRGYCPQAWWSLKRQRESHEHELARWIEMKAGEAEVTALDTQVNV